MGYTTRNNGQIKDFWPDDSESEFYILENASLADIIERAQLKWGDSTSFEDITIEAVRIHTECLTYDLYDPSDYTNFVLVKTYTGENYDYSR